MRVQLPSGARDLIFDLIMHLPWADPDDGEQGVRTPPYLKIKTIKGFSNTGPYPLENPKVQCWATNGPPAKRHLNGVSLAGQ